MVRRSQRPPSPHGQAARKAAWSRAAPGRGLQAVRSKPSMSTRGARLHRLHLGLSKQSASFLLWLRRPLPCQGSGSPRFCSARSKKGGTTFPNTWEAESVTRMRVSSTRELPLTPRGKPIIGISSQACHRWRHKGSLQSAVVGAFTPWKVADTRNQGFFLPPESRELVTSPPLESVRTRNPYIAVKVPLRTPPLSKGLHLHRLTRDVTALSTWWHVVQETPRIYKTLPVCLLSIFLAAT